MGLLLPFLSIQMALKYLVWLSVWLFCYFLFEGMIVLGGQFLCVLGIASCHNCRLARAVIESSIGFKSSECLFSIPSPPFIFLLYLIRIERPL